MIEHVGTGQPAPEITTSEERGVRYLHFGSRWIQGAMRIRSPDTLELEYTRQMMAWLLFLEPPQRLLQLGLGAGSMTRFVLAQMPQTAVTVVEISRSVVDLAHHSFRLPRQHPQLTIAVADAGDFVREPEQRGRYGVVQIDLYDQAARGPVLESEAFYTDCRNMLAAEAGLCVVNLFGEHESFARNILRLEQVFDGRVLMLPPSAAGNVVAIAVSGPSLVVPFDLLQPRATDIEQRYGLKAAGWVDAIRRSGYVTDGTLSI